MTANQRVAACRRLAESQLITVLHDEDEDISRTGVNVGPNNPERSSSTFNDEE